MYFGEDHYKIMSSSLLYEQILQLLGGLLYSINTKEVVTSFFPHAGMETPFLRATFPTTTLTITLSSFMLLVLLVLLIIILGVKFGKVRGSK